MSVATMSEQTPSFEFFPTSEEINFNDPNFAILGPSNPADVRTYGGDKPFASPFDNPGEWIGQTPSTNPPRPRTQAAGYDPNDQVLTIVFRDSTWWSYYDVPPDVWEAFKTTDSPGKFLREYEIGNYTLDTWPNMGRVSFGKLSPQIRTYLKKMGVGGTWERYRQVYKARGARIQRA